MPLRTTLLLPLLQQLLHARVRSKIVHDRRVPHDRWRIPCFQSLCQPMNGYVIVAKLYIHLRSLEPNRCVLRFQRQCSLQVRQRLLLFAEHGVVISQVPSTTVSRRIYLQFLFRERDRLSVGVLCLRYGGQGSYLRRRQGFPTEHNCRSFSLTAFSKVLADSGNCRR